MFHAMYVCVRSVGWIMGMMAPANQVLPACLTWVPKGDSMESGLNASEHGRWQKQLAFYRKAFGPITVSLKLGLCRVLSIFWLWLELLSNPPQKRQKRTRSVLCWKLGARYQVWCRGLLHRVAFVTWALLGYPGKASLTMWR